MVPRLPCVTQDGWMDLCLRISRSTDPCLLLAWVRTLSCWGHGPATSKNSRTFSMTVKCDLSKTTLINLESVINLTFIL